ncbi:MAG TPA: RHS repeat-associated core domain-containing protein, partial [Xanthomonadaceae bacterium]|nr:RHS repeat-associated core domain-containing protein [Xanthomonadaceae bacterium]
TSGTCGGGANAVKRVMLAGGGTRAYCYDADGNLTSDNAGLAVSYDHDNLPIKITRGTATINLYYGPDGQHTREVGSDGTKVYLDGGYEDWISAGTTKVYAGPAEITDGSTRTVNYVFTDRLGSVDGIVDSNGNLVETRGSDAFGKPRTGTWADTSPAQLQSTAITAHGFTGHEHLNSVQLIHMNGRVYDYQLGRFLSVDPIIQAPLNSQSLNPYSYIMNNPLAGTDPTGYCAQGEVELGDGGGSSAGCETNSGFMEGAQVTYSAGTDLAGPSSRQFSNGALKQTTSTQGTTSTTLPLATPNPSWCPNCQFKTDPSSPVALSNEDVNNSKEPDTRNWVQKQFAGSIFDVAGTAIATDVAYVVGGLSGHSALQDAAADGFTERVGAKNAAVTVITLGMGGREGEEVGGAVADPTVRGYGVGDPPSRFAGPWTQRDLQRAADGKGPLDFIPTTNAAGKEVPLELHHAGQMPGSAVHEAPPVHSKVPGLHPNQYNQGVSPAMRTQDANLHWQMRGQEMGNPPPTGG